MAARRLTRRHELMRILVPQLLQRESAAPGNGHRFFEQLTRIEFREPLTLAQITFTIGIELLASFPNRHVMPDRCNRVLEPPTRTHVHMNVAAGYQREREMPADPQQRLEMLAIHPIAKQLGGN